MSNFSHINGTKAYILHPSKRVLFTIDYHANMLYNNGLVNAIIITTKYLLMPCHNKGMMMMWRRGKKGHLITAIKPFAHTNWSI